MQKVEFLTLNGQTLSLELNVEFIESTRQHTLGEGGPTAYIAPVSHVVAESVDTDELCVAIVLPGLTAEAIDYSQAGIGEQVRTRPDGTPVACALLANGKVAVNAHALNRAQPLDLGRLTVLCVFEDSTSLRHYHYDEETETRLWGAASVADGHRHETDYGVGVGVNTAATPTVVEVLSYFVVEMAG